MHLREISVAKKLPRRNWKKYPAYVSRTIRALKTVQLPNVKIVIDRFHVVRYCAWAMDDVRRKLQQSLIAESRRTHILLAANGYPYI